MAIAGNLGFPRIGSRRQLKRAVEDFWKGTIDPEDLVATASELRREHWQLQQAMGIEHIPSNDFSLFDHVLDTTVMLGAVPKRFAWSNGSVDVATYFAMARGDEQVTPLHMTKWFDTNYHYLVPEFEPGMTFKLASTKPVDDFREAAALEIHTRPVLVGPLTFLFLGRLKGTDANRFGLLEKILPIYEDVLSQLAAAGADWVQIDEPILALDLPKEAIAALQPTYERLSDVSKNVRICLATYFGDLRENLPTALKLPVAAVHLDLVRAPEQLPRALDLVPDGLTLSLGVVDGRNVWRTDLERALGLLEKATAKLGAERVIVAPSCSLLHTPMDLDNEPTLDAELKSWMAFAKQKLQEVKTLAEAVNKGRPAVEKALAESRAAIQSRATSKRIHNPAVKDRLAKVDEAMLRRPRPFAERITAQQKVLKLPLLPTTTIGSFPQTAEVRKARAGFKKGELTREQYETFCEKEIEQAIRFQEDIDLDMLVHGEFERTDMVEYFADQLEGFAFTANGWVQSVGSLCVKPPIIFGDVSRPKPMTVRWSQYAQSKTSRPMKGMLTGPITILQWSFVRDDQPRRDTAMQLAFAVRDEVADLEGAGIRAIQIDEPALREGLPLCREGWKDYLRWAVDAFRLASAVARPDTQIHTHMCYSEFNDIIDSIAALDADVISIEASRSDMELLQAFVKFRYPNDIGPGLYDIHSPRVPEADEMVGRLQKILRTVPAERLWVNPDCGLKTRNWPEVQASLSNMVAAAKSVRSTLKR